MSAPARLGAGRYLAAGERPAATVTTVHELTTSDGATVRGVLATVPGARTVVCLMHPRQDVTHHPLVPLLLQAGAAVWTQHTRSVNNDLTLVHEQALLDVAAGHGVPARAGSPRSSRSGTPAAARSTPSTSSRPALPARRRASRRTPGGRPDRARRRRAADAPTAPCSSPRTPARAGCCWPASTPRSPTRPTRSPWCPSSTRSTRANGFAEPPTSSSYAAEFLARYRAAQRDRVARIDAVARGPPRPHRRGARGVQGARGGAPTAGGRSRPRSSRCSAPTPTRAPSTSRSIPSDRPYGSLFGTRPDLIDYGQVGFGRLTTPEAWLSTWSGLSLQRRLRAVRARRHRADAVRRAHRRPGRVPRRLPPHGRRARRGRPHARPPCAACTSAAPIADGEPTGNELAADEIAAWLGRALPRGRSSADEWATSRRCIASVGRADGQVGTRSAGGAYAGGRPAPGGSVWVRVSPWWWS